MFIAKINFFIFFTIAIVRELNRQLQELQIQLQRNRAKIAEDAQQLEVTIFCHFFERCFLTVVTLCVCAGL